MTLTVASLYQFKREEQPLNDHGSLGDVTEANSLSFKYESSLLAGLGSEAVAQGDDAPAHHIFKNAQILVPLKYVSSFFRSQELPLIDTKLHLQLPRRRNCIMSTVGNDNNNNTNTFQITKTELHVPVVTLKTSDNEKLSELLSKGLEREVPWNE